MSSLLPTIAAISGHKPPHIHGSRGQAGGVHEKELLAKWQNDLIGNSIAIGESTKGAISHMKIVIVDGVYTVRGSTNWSLAGEQKQDNELTIHNNAVIAAETRAELRRSLTGAGRSLNIRMT